MSLKRKDTGNLESYLDHGCGDKGRTLEVGEEESGSCLLPNNPSHLSSSAFYTTKSNLLTLTNTTNSILYL